MRTVARVSMLMADKFQTDRISVTVILTKLCLDFADRYYVAFYARRVTADTKAKQRAKI